MTTAGAEQRAPDHDVVVVGGGPTGCSAAVFTARYGLDTVVFDRGPAALPRCAYLSNYPGFPAGIDVETFQDLLHAHVAEAGADRREEQVTAVERRDEEPGFVVETDTGGEVTTEYVLAAAWYDGSYLRPLGEDAMFELQEHHGEEERFAPDYPDADGRTPVEGLYVASPSGRSEQAIIAAGNGAHVARSLVEDVRRDEGYAGDLASHFDWLRSESEFSGEWAERDRWREWFENELPDDYDLDEDRLVELRERYIDGAFGTALSDEAAAARAERGRRELIEGIGAERVLDAIDDERIREYVSE
ncbi:FAD-dependent oxidoreductase [Haloglomus salinum]|uniref:FAD-dependent oxidoreductase n=1 Tax=Haloglomus salinum TaxID=2962673 RepID=UPI0020C980CD|nr:FAD-dependent oxidoreductase [Haloglomus salinum]